MPTTHENQRTVWSEYPGAFSEPRRIGPICGWSIYDGDHNVIVTAAEFDEAWEEAAYVVARRQDHRRYIEPVASVHEKSPIAQATVSGIILVVGLSCIVYLLCLGARAAIATAAWVMDHPAQSLTPFAVGGVCAWTWRRVQRCR